jgi:NAD(P)-dependent dehydrogenase (short-subunit alcohol dehydrogenase family)
MGINMFDISGKVAVVTGASGVLGGSIAESLMKAVLAAIVEYKNQQIE